MIKLNTSIVSILNNIKVNRSRHYKRPIAIYGFTIIEIIVVIVIIGILTTIGVASYSGYQKSVISLQLKSDLGNAASAMLNARAFGNTGYPPDVNTITTFAPSQGVTLVGGSTDGGKTYCIDATSSKNASLYFHIDSKSGGSGAQLDTSASVYPVPASFTAVGVSSSAINLSWGSVAGATSYVLQRDTSPYFTSATTIATQIGTTFTSSGLAMSTTYYYRVNDTTPAGTSGWVNTSAATTGIDAPAAPSVTINTVSPTSTWSWAAVTCTSGTPRYQYDYTISPSGFDSGWVSIASSPVAFTTSTAGQTYTVVVQAQCYIGANSSGWSGSGSAFYIDYGNAVAANLLSGKTATTDAGSITGTMTNKVGSATIITPSTVDQAIPTGYYGGIVGDGKVLGDTDLIAGNILSGINIFGVTGSLSASSTHSSQTYTTPGTYSFTVPATVTQIVALVIGGGGKGETGHNGGTAGPGGGWGGSGGGAGQIKVVPVAVTPGQVISVVVGAGSAQSSFGATIALPGNLGDGNGNGQPTMFLSTVNNIGGTGGWGAGGIAGTNGYPGGTGSGGGGAGSTATYVGAGGGGGGGGTDAATGYPTGAAGGNGAPGEVVLNW